MGTKTSQSRNRPVSGTSSSGHKSVHNIHSGNKSHGSGSRHGRSQSSGSKGGQSVRIKK